MKKATRRKSKTLNFLIFILEIFAFIPLLLFQLIDAICDILKRKNK